MYFTIRRIVIFLLGVFLFLSALIMLFKGLGSVGSIVGVIGLGVVGSYFIIASLIPHKEVVKVVADEVIGDMLLSVPEKVIEKIGDIL